MRWTAWAFLHVCNFSSSSLLLVVSRENDTDTETEAKRSTERQIDRHRDRSQETQKETDRQTRETRDLELAWELVRRLFLYLLENRWEYYSVCAGWSLRELIDERSWWQKWRWDRTGTTWRRRFWLWCYNEYKQGVEREGKGDAL